VQVAIHTDTLNESGFVDDDARRLQGPHDPHLPHRGAGGGHAPDIMRACAASQRAAVVDQPDPAVHREHRRRAPRHADGLPPPRPGDPEDVAFAESRIRRETIAAEDILHDLGAICR
jgi:urease subunit alpha